MELGRLQSRLCRLGKELEEDKINAFYFKDVSLDIYAGEITAILGHNGAGKSTLFNMLTGMTSSSGGSATIFGYDIK